MLGESFVGGIAEATFLLNRILTVKRAGVILGECRGIRMEGEGWTISMAGEQCSQKWYNDEDTFIAPPHTFSFFVAFPPSRSSSLRHLRLHIRRLPLLLPRILAILAGK